MSASPRHDIREHLDAIVEIASRADPAGVDAALHDMPPSWDVVSIVSERHGYGYVAVLQECVVPGSVVVGRGRTMAEAIRAAFAAAQPVFASEAST